MRRFLILTLFLFGLSIPSTGFAATLSVSPSGGVYSVGDRISLKVVVSSNDAPMNAVSGVMLFPSALFSIDSISKGGSILNFWVTEPFFSNSAGTVQFEGVSLSGFQGSAGTVIVVNLRARKVGSGTVSFQSGQILANDGQGTDITRDVIGGTFQIVAAKVQPVAPQPVAPPPQEVSEPEPQAPVVTLSAPVISLGEQDSLPAIIGASAYQRANVLLTFMPVTGSKLFITGVTNEDGNFTLIVPQALRNGAYAVNAIVVRDDTQSISSNVLTVEVGGVFVADVSWENATYMSAVLIVFLILLVAYFLWRRYFGPRRRVNVAIKKEVKEAEDVLHQSVTLLDQDLSEHLKRSTKAGGLKNIEREDIVDIKRDLSDAEKYIEKEIRDISRIQLDEKN
mgnify:CR=1 FL=1